MRFADLLLIITILFILGWPFTRLRKRHVRWFDVVPTFAGLQVLVHLFLIGSRVPMWPLYLLAMLLFLLSLKQLVKPVPIHEQKRSPVGLSLAIVGRMFALLLLLLPFLPTSLFSSSQNVQHLAWIDAFEAMHAQLWQQYAFGQWKAIEWDALYAQFAPRIAEAEANDDADAYYLALREYAFSIPDGHIELGADKRASAFVERLKTEAVGGGYGLALLELDDGRIIAHILLSDGPAAQAGVEWGAEIVAWNGQPIQEALDEVSILWANLPHATLEGQQLEKLRFLVRAPIDSEAEITYQNPSANSPTTVRLSAVGDNLETLRRTQILNEEFDPRDPAVQAEILPSGIGYLKITVISAVSGSPTPIQDMREAMQTFIEQDVPGIIIDVRGNVGGMDSMVPNMVDFFFDTQEVKEALYYEQAAYYSRNTQKFEVDPSSSLFVQPDTPHYSGPVVVLIDKGTLSSGEGIPLMIQRLPQGTIIGTHGTYGSFGLTGGEINLPTGYALYFPTGQSLDAKQTIQLDSDHTLQGGVQPDVRVPLTEERARAMYIEGRDIVLEFAVDFLQEKR